MDAYKILGVSYEATLDDCKKAYFANYQIKEEQWHSDVHDFDASRYNGKIDLFFQ